MKKISIIAAALIVLVPLGMWWFSTEQVIIRKTKHLMEVLTISDGTGRPLRQAKVFSMNALLAPEVKLTIPDIADANGTFDKQEMESAFSWICQNAKESQFQVTRIKSMEIDDDRAVIEVDAEVKGFIELPSYRPADGSFDVTITWIKMGDGWRFSGVVWKNL